MGISRMNGGNKFSTVGFIGTPQYSAPEQIKRGEGNNTTTINATTDIYELGITFYELLTGENPMDCEAEVETLAHQLTKPLPASPLIPKKLMHVIWKATEKEQGRRYQTAAEFKNAIQEAQLPDPPVSERIINWVKDNVIIVIFSVLAIVLLLISIILIIA